MEIKLFGELERKITEINFIQCKNWMPINQQRLKIVHHFTVFQ